MIEISQLAKNFGEIAAVRGIDFTVRPGDVLGFLGPNGAGKSTTMKILSCFIPPTTGSASVAGFDAVSQSIEVRRRVGYLPENNPLYTEMRVEEFLKFRAAIKGVAGRDRARAVDATLDKCSLQDVRRRIIGQLSKGYRQRVGMADAIVHDPDVVILDEPTIGLDPNQVRHIRDVIRELGEKHTVILSTHILSEVEKMCGRVLIINRGKLVANGRPGDIVQQLTATGRVRLDVRGAADGAKEALEKVPGVRSVVTVDRGDVRSFLIEGKDTRDVRPELVRVAAQAGWDVVELTLERVSLEDAFVELTVAPKVLPVAPTPAPAEAATGGPS